MIRRLLAIMLLWLATPALAADPAGRWALRSGETILMVFEVAQTRKGWSSAWLRPEHFASDGDSFGDVHGAVVRRSARRVQASADAVALTVAGPDGTDETFVLRAISPTRATLDFTGFGDEPALLTRVGAGVAPGGWTRDETYLRPAYRPTDAGMTALFDADQAACADPAKIDWKRVTADDAARRARTQALLDAGRLHSADDFYHAAFVFQHGDKPEDFLKAHALAVVAAARGKPAATWIAAATLDRYLRALASRRSMARNSSIRQARAGRRSRIAVTCCPMRCAGRVAYRRLPRRRSSIRNGSGACPSAAARLVPRFRTPSPPLALRRDHKRGRFVAAPSSIGT